MAVNPILINAKTILLSKGQGISSDELNAFFNTTAIDLAAITNVINTYLVPIVNGMPALVDNSIDPVYNVRVDGSQLFVDKDATINTNSGLFYSTVADNGSGGFGRPITVKESLLTILQLIARSAATNYEEDTETLTVSAQNASDNWIQITDAGGIITSNSKFKVYVNTSGFTATRLLPSSYTINTATKRLVENGNFVLVENNKLIIDYSTTTLILP